ncbi:MAG: cellulase family glycosylhydrolase [[Eubacterium] siraeum]|uniref:Endoglucanase n=1 Tax=[Eubacterium] siraeum TaxID=39492 RepID=A0AAW6D4S9_9FIRM|nr:cellulase family glycosylhydrolase [[Eubacterium] siraeum]MDB8004640.1 cellulase family glycosylhydrolase [[Eubacterium] siraeum]
MKKSIIRRAIAVFIAAAMLAGCAAQDSGVLSSVGNSSATESNVSYIEDTSSVDENSEVTSVDSSVTESDTSSDTSEQEESNTSKQENTSKAENTEKPADTTKAPSTADTKNNSQSKPASSASNFTVQWKKSSSWEEGGKKCGGYEIVITNNGDTVNSWTAKVTVPGNTKLMSQWNGIFSISGNTMTVKNESYNGTIEKGKSVSFGFNYSADAYINEGKVTVNGSTAGTSAGNNSNNNNNNNNNNNTSTTKKPAATVPPAPSDPKGTTPVSQHGQLSVKNGQLVDKSGKGYQLRGMSTHGLTWFPEFVNESAFKTLRDDWNTNVVRLAMYVDEWGNGQCYMGNKSGSLELLEKGVDICIKLDMYVIIDWHVLNPGDPSKYTNEAKSFFETVSKRYAKYPNVIYEICNEPNGGASWSGNIKPYAEKIIPVIRKNAPNSVIIVGTPTWSQEIDKPLSDPLNYKNVMYAFHFYAATHAGLRSNVENCVAQGLPVFVSEFGTCDASGGGANDFNETQKWLSYFDKQGISYCNWSICNKDETCSVLRPGTSANGNWSESNLTENGKWIRNWLKKH